MQDVWWSIRRLEFYSEIHPDNLKLWRSLSHTNIRYGVKQHFSDTQDLIFLHKAWQFVAILFWNSTSQFEAFRIYKPHKCKLCSSNIFHWILKNWIFFTKYDNLQHCIFIGHIIVRCGELFESTFCFGHSRLKFSSHIYSEHL